MPPSAPSTRPRSSRFGTSGGDHDPRSSIASRAAVRVARCGPQVQCPVAISPRSHAPCGRARRARCRGRKAAGARSSGARRGGRLRTAAPRGCARVKGGRAVDKAVTAAQEAAISTRPFNTDLMRCGGPTASTGRVLGADNPARAGPVMKVASGGDLRGFCSRSRCARDRGSAPTLVFDEIDTAPAGRSGRHGLRLARLAAGAGALGHARAAVAARAERHYLITKDALERGNAVATRVNEVAAERLAERSRACCRRRDHREARAAAERLIKGGGCPPCGMSVLAARPRQTPATRSTQTGAADTRGCTRIAAHDNRYYRRRRHRSDADTMLAAALRAIGGGSSASPRCARSRALAQDRRAPTGRFKKVRHAVPMLSLGTLRRRRRRIASASGASASPQDEPLASRRAEDRRLSMSLRYEAARSRRGDARRRRGRRRVTANIKTLKACRTAPGQRIPAMCEVRGEST